MPGKQSHSTIKHPLIKFLGSIQLAVPLLAAIAVVLIWATIVESRVGSDIVQREIYKSGWFGLLMLLLAVNLSVSAISRFPWRGPRKIGFALTHFGLVLLIAGSAAVIHLGVEGMLLLRTDLGASRMLRLPGEVLEILASDGATDSMGVEISANGSVKRGKIAGLEVVDYRDSTLSRTRFLPDGPVPNPAIHLSLTSKNMGQSVREWLATVPSSAQQVNLGPARLQLVSVDSDDDLQAAIAPPSGSSGAVSAGKWGALVLAEGGNSQTLDVQQSLGKTVTLPGNLRVRVVNFWPDFRLNDRNEPETASPQLRNPALQLQVEAPSGVERWFVFGRKDFTPVRTVVSGEPSQLAASYQPPSGNDNLFRAIATPSGDLYYAVNSSNGFRAGRLRIGEPIDMGWADFQLELLEYIASARPEREIVEVAASDGPTAPAEAVPAVLVKPVNGSPQWLQWGTPQAFDRPDGEIYAVYTPKSMELPFAVALEDFIVERNEGSESVAMWTSQIRIDDAAYGGHAFRKVWMNHPTWYRGWKIAQASWNPGDLRQSTLQVKREPGWVTALTWSGSLLVVTGIGVMFYGQEVTKTFQKLFGQSR